MSFDDELPPVDDWKALANCLGAPYEVFFFVDVDNPRKIARAKAICAECPVRPECLDHAMGNHEEGIWAGLTEKERRNARRRARRAAQRHGDDAAYHQHRANGTDPCAACRAGHAIRVQVTRPSRAIRAIA